MIVKPLSEGLAEVQKATKKGPPPLELWNPPFCGDMDMRIARDGTWFHEGSPIGRAPMVKLFSSILWREGDEYFLKTPVEKVRIQVEDAPLIAVDFEAEGAGEAQVLRFFTKTEDDVVAGAANPLRVVMGVEPRPYVHIRRGLEARIDRKTFYRMIDLGVHHEVDGQSWFGIWSDGCFFSFIPSLELG